MRDGDFRVVAMLFVVGCSKTESVPPHARASGSVATIPAAAAPAPACPATGNWASCSVVYRLERAGLAPHVDSSATPDERSLHGRPLVLKIGFNAKLEVFLYADSTTRVADERALDRRDYVSATASQTIKRERTLIENANLVGLLSSTNDLQRERVSDALTAGPPQPSKP